MDDVLLSGFSDEILDYMDYYEEQGRNRRSIYYAMKFFDKYCYSKYQQEKIFTMEDAAYIYKARPKKIKETTFYGITGTLHAFTSYLVALGYDIGVIQQVGSYKDYSFTPHIYSQEEKKRYCIAADLYTNVHQPILSQMVPVMVRTLQCCGLRASELLNLRKSDVHLDCEYPYLLIRKSKNGLKRYVPLSRTLTDLYKLFYKLRITSMIDEDDFIFIDGSGAPISHQMLYAVHKELLCLARIGYDGHGKGPRLHDWRHTFCIESFTQLLNLGIDGHNAIMLVSTVMGHQHYTATEKYLRLTKTMFPEVAKALDQIYVNVGQKRVFSEPK